MAGYDPDAFWGQTPATFDSAMQGAATRARMEGERDLALAHTIAVFDRAEKLKPLAKYLPPRPGAPRKKTGVTLAALESIAAATAHLG